MSMSSIETLRREYPGDTAWANFAAIFKPDPMDDRLAAMRVLIPEDTGLSATILGILHDEAENWFGQPIGVLDGRSPAHLVATHPDGVRILRHVLMRMPV